MQTVPHPIRALHVLPSLGKEGQLGGAERMVTLLVNHLKKEPALDVRLCVLGERDPFYASYGISEEPIFLKQPHFQFSWHAFLRAVRSLKSVVREWQPHVVHSHLWAADMIAAAALTPSAIRHVVHIHDVWVLLRSTTWRRKLRRAVYGVLMRGSRARFIACAESVKSDFARGLHFQPSRIEVIQNGLESSWLRHEPGRAPSTDRFDIGYAARLQSGKGQHVLIEAFAKVAKAIPHARLLLAGEGSQREAYRESARSLGIQDRVVFLGRVREMQPFYDGLDVYACPSFSEGLPMSILEAMARGLPVVATQVGGIPEIMADGVNGILVPPGNPDAMAEALIALASDPERRGALGRAAQARIREHFLADRVIEKLHHYYERILAT